MPAVGASTPDASVSMPLASVSNDGFGALRRPVGVSIGAVSDKKDAMSAPVHVIGAGLAGSECAWQLARRGVPVVLHEMRPGRGTPAHKGGDFAELVCSNSLRSDDPHHAAGLLKREMEELGSLIIAAARRAAPRL